jgi:hypothetical protein
MDIRSLLFDEDSTKVISTTSAPELFESSPTYAPSRDTDVVTPELFDEDELSYNFTKPIPQTPPNSPQLAQYSKRKTGAQRTLTSSAKISKESERRSAQALQLSKLQNALLGLNPEIAHKANWRLLLKNNIPKVSDITEDALRYNKVDVMVSAVRSLEQMADIFAAIFKERKGLQNLIEGMKVSGVESKDVLDRLDNYFWENDFSRLLGIKHELLGVSSTFKV